MNLLNSVYTLLTSVLSLGSPPALATSKAPAQVIVKGTPSLPQHVLPADTPLPKKAFAPTNQQYYLNFDTSLEDIPASDKDAHAKTLGSYYEQGIWEPLFPGSLRAKRSLDQTYFKENDLARNNMQMYRKPFAYSKPEYLFDVMAKMSDDLKGREFKYPVTPFSKSSLIRTYTNLDEDVSTNTRYNLLPNIGVNVPSPFQQANSILQQNQHLPLLTSTDKSFYDYDVFTSPINTESKPETYFYPTSSKSSITRALPLSYDYIPNRMRQTSLFDSDYVRKERQSTYPTQHQYLSDLSYFQHLPETNSRSRFERFNNRNKDFIDLSKAIMLLENFLNDGNLFLDYLRQVNGLQQQQNEQKVFDSHEIFSSLRKNKMLPLKNPRSKRDATTSSLSLKDISKLLELLKSVKQYIQIANDIIQRLPPGAQEVVEEVKEFVKKAKNAFISKFKSKLQNVDSISKLISTVSNFRGKRGIRDGNIDEHDRSPQQIDGNEEFVSHIYKRNTNHNDHRISPCVEEALPELKEVAQKMKNHFKSEWKEKLNKGDTDFILRLISAARNIRHKRGTRDGDIDQHERNSHHSDSDEDAVRNHEDRSHSPNRIHIRKSNSGNANAHNPYVPNRPFYAGQSPD